MIVLRGGAPTRQAPPFGCQATHEQRSLARAATCETEGQAGRPSPDSAKIMPMAGSRSCSLAQPQHNTDIAPHAASSVRHSVNSVRQSVIWAINHSLFSQPCPQVPQSDIPEARHAPSASSSAIGSHMRRTGPSAFLGKAAGRCSTSGTSTPHRTTFWSASMAATAAGSLHSVTCLGWLLLWLGLCEMEACSILFTTFRWQ